MKQISGCILAFFLALQVMGQDVPVVKDKQYYLDKSKAQRTTGWIFAGAGVAMIVGGTIAVQESLSNTEGLIAFAGVPVALASIPFFISASRNKERAEAMVGPVLQPVQLYGTAKTYVPGIAIRIRL